MLAFEEGIYGSITITSNTFAGNSAIFLGTGIYINNNFDLNVTIQNNTFVNNQALSGGAIAITSVANSTVYMINNTYSNNTAGKCKNNYFES
jgi:hypothetical protein